MSLARPCVNVYGLDRKRVGTVAMPTVMEAPIRPDLVQFVHNNMARNHRQAYGVKENAGYQTSAESWGTGRAVARIPRVPGGGTHRAGQAAFGNMCRGGGMFSPIKTWRRWHRKINLTQKRHALCSSLAGSAYSGLVIGRGHKVDDVPELPLVVSDDLQSLTKTKDAIAFFNQLGCGKDLDRVTESKKIRAGKGKRRNRRYVTRRGPLVVYNKDEGLQRAFANIPGVDLCHVDRLNLLKTSPGGTIGRLMVWTESAFKRLQALYGDYTIGSSEKADYVMERPMMTNADIHRIINSAEIQSVLRPKVSDKERMRKPDNKHIPHRNPLRSYAAMKKLDPLNNYRCSVKAKAVKKTIQKNNC